MSRDLDPTLASALPSGSIMPIVLAALTFKSGVAYVWSGIGDLVWNGNTFKGVGGLGSVSAISEGSSVKADGTSVKLSGLSLSAIPPVAPPTGVVPPVFPVPAGQFVAWITPATAVASVGATSEGTAACTLDSGTLIMTQSTPLGADFVKAVWGGFNASTLPTDAVIVNIYPVLVISGTGSGALNGAGTISIPLSGSFSGQYNGIPITTLAAMEAASIYAEISASGGSTFLQTLGITFIGMAVYYTSASGSATFLQESLNDIQLGAPAQIWFGAWQDGGIYGTPYLVFGGTVDQPTLKVDATTVDFNLALENRLSNLQRANQRRYTAADQHLDHPDDTGFNYVEIENDIAERWGG